MPDVMTIAGIALKTSLVIVATGLLSIAWRRQSAALRHALWTLALALCVLMPLVVLFVPSYQLAWMHVKQTNIAGAVVPSGSFIVTSWLVGTSLVLLRELLGSIGLARWLRHAQPLASTRWAATLARISTAHSLRVLESQHIASHCTWGVLRPILLLPTAGEAWPESARYAALTHELAHIQRRDAISTLVSRFACALHWYNPLVWFAAGRVRSLQERACDDEVLRAGATPSDYAQFLLDVAAHMSGMSRPARAAIGMTHGTSLRARIVAILDPQAMRSRPQRVRLVAACASLLVLTILVATASVAIEPPLPQIPPLPELPKLAIPPTLPIPPVPPVPPVLP
jgi:beta-lactamase regulating signal transducer with metallopeptidase domain